MLKAAGKPVATLFLSGFSTRRSLKASFADTWKLLQDNGLSLPIPEAKTAFLKTPKISLGQFNAVRQMLAISCGNLAEFANRRLVQAASYENPIVLQAKHYVRAHSTQSMNMKEVARVVGVSMTYFSRIFKKETGMSFTGYVNRVRLEKVKSQLLSRQKSINETASEAGFESISHFNRVFKKYEGKSPVRYREELQSGVLSKTRHA